MLDETRADRRQEMLGRMIVAEGLLSEQELAECLRERDERSRQGESIGLERILIERRVIDGRRLGDLLQRLRPTAIGNYQLGPKLGEGAGAEVYEAVDTELKRTVALKVLKAPPGEIGGTLRKRFEREARASARLTHPNVVRVFDVGESNGRLYLAMERVDGPSLRAVLEGDPIPLRKRIALLEAVARGVDHAHQAGVVHRDLKPGNILVAAGGVPKVCDFGLARIDEALTNLTRSDAILGTPLYMSPEQVAGGDRPITVRSDVYALGTILYQMLTGSPPFTGRTAAELFSRILSDLPRPPRAIDPSIPAALEAVALTALEKDPAHRYATAAALADDLASWLAGGRVSARSSAIARRWRRARRHRPIAAAIVGSALLTGLVVLVLVGRRADPAASPTEPPPPAVADDAPGADLAEGREALEAARAMADRSGVEAADLHRLAGAARTALERYLGEHPDDGPALDLLGQALELAGEGNAARAAWQRSLAIDPGRPETARRLARHLWRRALVEQVASTIHDLDLRRERAEGHLGAAAALLESIDGQVGLDGVDGQLIAALRTVLARRPDETVRAAQRILDGDLADADRSDALVLLSTVLASPQSVDVLRQALDLRPTSAIAYLARAIDLLTLGSIDGAIAEFSAAVRFAPEMADAFFHRGSVLSKTGQPDRALEDYERALAVDPDHYMAANGRGYLLLEGGDLRAALADLDHALSVHPGYVQCRINRGLARQGLGDLEGALADYERVTVDDPDNPWGYNNCAAVLLELRRPADAIPSCDEALRLDPSLAKPRINRAQARLALGQAAEALPDLDRLLVEYPDSAIYLGTRAEAREQLGDLAGALADLDRAVRIDPSPIAFHRRGRVRRQLGDRVGAIADLRRALARLEGPMRPVIEEELAALLAGGDE